MRTKFCAYCRTYKSPDGGKDVVTVSGARTTRRFQCAGCISTRQLPREKLEELAQQDAAQRRKVDRAATLASLDKRRKSSCEP